MLGFVARIIWDTPRSCISELHWSESPHQQFLLLFLARLILIQLDTQQWRGYDFQQPTTIPAIMHSSNLLFFDFINSDQFEGYVPITNIKPIIHGDKFPDSWTIWVSISRTKNSQQPIWNHQHWKSCKSQQIDTYKNVHRERERKNIFNIHTDIGIYTSYTYIWYLCL